MNCALYYLLLQLGEKPTPTMDRYIVNHVGDMSSFISQNADFVDYLQTNKTDCLPQMKRDGRPIVGYKLYFEGTFTPPAYAFGYRISIVPIDKDGNTYINKQHLSDLLSRTSRYDLMGDDLL